MNKYEQSKCRKIGFLPGSPVLLAALVAVLALGTASAQTSQPSTESASSGTGSADLSEIVVSAKRAGVSVDKIPVAVTILGADELQQLQIVTTEDLQGHVPSLQTDNALGIPKVFIRGIGQTGTTIGQDGGVAQYVDGVYINDSEALYTQQLDINRIEVLRGPQGTLFGKNATGGTIQYYSNQPTFQPEVDVSLLGGNYDRFRTQVIANGPIIDNELAGRAAFSYDTHEGYTEDLAGGPNRDNLNSTAGRVSLLFTPIQDFKAVLSGDFDNDRSNGPSFLLLNNLSQFPTSCNGGLRPPACQYYVTTDQRITITAPGFLEDTGTKVWGTSLNLDSTLAGDFHLKSITGFRAIDWTQDNQAGGTYVYQIGSQPTRVLDHSLSQEFDLSGTVGRMDGVVGAFYSRSQAHNYSDVAFGVPFGGPGAEFYLVNLKTTSKALFGDGTYHVTDRFRIDGGLRYTWDEKNDVQQNYLVFGPYTIDNNGVCTGQTKNPNGTTTADNTASWSQLTWRGAAEFDVTPGTMLYVSATKGYKAGGFTDFSVCGQSFLPEEVISYEAGIKGHYFGDRLTTRLDGYDMKYTDLQLVTEIGANLETTTNAAKAVIPGIEFEGTFKVTSAWSLDTHEAWTSAHYQDYVHAFPLGNGVGEQLGGTPLNDTPRFSGGVGLNWATDLGSVGRMTARAETTFTTNYRFNPYTEFDVEHYGAIHDDQKGYVLANFYLTYFAPGDRYSVAGFVKNATNQFYSTSELDQVGTGSMGFPNAPRTYGVELRGKFR